MYCEMLGVVMVVMFLVVFIFIMFFICFEIFGIIYVDKNYCFKDNVYFYVIRKGIGIFCVFVFYV